MWASLVAQIVESAWGVGDQDSIPELGRSPKEENGNPLQSSCLENPMGGGAWQAMVHGVTKNQTRLNDFTFTLSIYRNPLHILVIVFIFYMQLQNLNCVLSFYSFVLILFMNRGLGCFFFYEIQMINYSLYGWMVTCLTEKSWATIYQEDVLLFYFLEILIILPLRLRPLVY